MYAGAIVERAPVDELFARRSTRTRGACSPRCPRHRPAERSARCTSIAGQPPPADRRSPTGCSFRAALLLRAHARCARGAAARGPRPADRATSTPCWLPRPRPSRRRGEPMPPLLELDGVDEALPGRAGASPARGRHAAGRRRRRPRRRGGRDARPRRRVGLRQDDARPRCIAAACRADRAARSRFDGQRRLAASARRELRAAARATSQMVFQDPYASLNPRMRVGDDRRRAAAHPRPRRAERARAARQRAARARRASPRRRQPLPARVLGRPAPAHRHRARARARTRRSSSATSRSRRSTSRSRRRS